MKKLSIAVFALATVTLASWTFMQSDGHKAVTSLKLDAAQSKLAWTGKYVSDGHTHNGLVNITAGTINFEGDKFVSGDFTVDLTTIVDLDLPEGKNAYLVNHLKSGDFFNVEKFSTVPVKVTAVSDKEIKATLNVMGTEIPAVMPVKMTKTKDGMIAAGAFEIDFSATNMNGFKAAPNNPADARVHPVIAFDLNLVLKK